MALKFMLPDLVRDGNAVARFTREARAAVRLKSEHVGRVLDLGTLGDGTPYLVMEFLTGETVEQRLHREGPMSPGLAVEVILQASRALAEAHALGIVHRDLKPANLFNARLPTGAEQVKVLDFGIAKSVHPDIEAGLAVSSQRMLVGSPQYMAPEQLTPGAPVTEAVDVWALGCTLYQLLCGEPPFNDASSLVNLMYAIQNTPHRPLVERVPRAAALSPIIDGCLAKKPEQRWPLARLQAALQAFRVDDAVTTAPALAPPEARPVELVPLRRRSLLPWMAGAAGALVLTLVLAAFFPRAQPVRPVERLSPPAAEVRAPAPPSVPEPLAPVPEPLASPRDEKPKVSKKRVLPAKAPNDEARLDQRR